mmetsp:Transcript_39533/g.60361  ORF Transcript_39533/g.60361 Transcript_39533/m.60361 type:complete len:316 (-) Transcript_39533:414-1361(-)
MHVVLFPLSLVGPTVHPLMDTYSVDLVVFPFTGVREPFVPLIGSDSVLLAIGIASEVDRAVDPSFVAEAVLQIVLPLAHEQDAVLLVEHAVAMRLVVDEVTLEEVSILVNELGSSMGLIELPLAFIPGAIRPSLHSVAISEVASPFTFIDRSGLELVLLLVPWTAEEVFGVLLLVVGERLLVVIVGEVDGQLEDLGLKSFSMLPGSVASNPSLQFDNELDVFGQVTLQILITHVALHLLFDLPRKLSRMARGLLAPSRFRGVDRMVAVKLLELAVARAVFFARQGRLASVSLHVEGEGLASFAHTYGHLVDTAAV